MKLKTIEGEDSNTYQGLANATKAESRNHDPHHYTASRLHEELNHHRNRQSSRADDRSQ
ncbi:unnamed protein product [Brassica rapa subsp. narinosa]